MLKIDAVAHTFRLGYIYVSPPLKNAEMDVLGAIAGLFESPPIHFLELPVQCPISFVVSVSAICSVISLKSLINMPYM